MRRHRAPVGVRRGAPSPLRRARAGASRRRQRRRRARVAQRRRLPRGGPRLDRATVGRKVPDTDEATGPGCGPPIPGGDLASHRPFPATVPDIGAQGGPRGAGPAPAPTTLPRTPILVAELSRAALARWTRPLATGDRLVAAPIGRSSRFGRVLRDRHHETVPRPRHAPMSSSRPMAPKVAGGFRAESRWASLQNAGHVLPVALWTSLLRRSCREADIGVVRAARFGTST